MQGNNTRLRNACALIATLPVLCMTAGAHAADSYNATNRQLSIPSIAIGGATYSNMVVTVGTIVSGPSGTAPIGSADTYDPGTNQLTVQSVTLGPATYYNVVVTVEGLVSIGGVSGADSFNGTDLSVSQVQFGPAVYAGVVVTEGLADVVSIAGGMPTYEPDTYNPDTNELAIPAVQVGNHVYTHVIVTAGTVLGASGIRSRVGESVLQSFSYAVGTSPDGANPTASMIQGRDGILYGTTAGGGPKNGGTVYKVSGGTETVVYSFCSVDNPTCTDGNLPGAGLIQGQGSDDNFYGTTQIGGATGGGTVFQLTPAGVETVLYSFSESSGSKDGLHPQGGLVQAGDGNFYGTTNQGGEHNQGTVFRVTPAGVETVLYSFSGHGGVSGSVDGSQPEAGLTLGRDGNFYGTTYFGGVHDYGTVFMVTPSGTETVLYSFVRGIGGATDGAYPEAGLIEGIDGNFYGTTSVGGTTGGGTVFRVTPAGAEKVLHSFSEAGNSTDGYSPAAGLILASDGNFYGTTLHGGVNFTGTAFKITPDGVETALHSFGGNADGASPRGGLVQAGDGNFYGTTYGGGALGEGTVFQLTRVIPVP